MPSTPQFRDFILELLAPFASPAAEITVKRAFGCYDLYFGGVIFAIIAHDVLFLKTDDMTRGDFEVAGSEPFTYEKKGKTIFLPYHALPDDAYEGPEELKIWVDKALEAARRATAKKPKARKKAKTG